MIIALEMPIEDLARLMFPTGDWEGDVGATIHAYDAARWLRDWLLGTELVRTEDVPPETWAHLVRRADLVS